MSIVRVRYVGLKPTEIDKKAKTGLVWAGHGCVREAPLAAWDDYFSKHPDVWELDTPAGGLGDAKAKAQEPEPLPTGPLDEPKHVADMADAELKAFAEANDIKVDKRLKGERLRAAIFDAIAGATA